MSRKNNQKKAKYFIIRLKSIKMKQFDKKIHTFSIKKVHSV